MPVTDPSVIEALVRRYRELGSAIAELKGEQDEIKTQVESLVPVGWKDQIDGVNVHRRAPNRTFDLITAISLLSPDDRDRCKVLKFDEKLVRASAESAGIIDECMISKADAAPVIKL